jgi:hypothetical protein
MNVPYIEITVIDTFPRSQVFLFIFVQKEGRAQEKEEKNISN